MTGVVEELLWALEAERDAAASRAPELHPESLAVEISALRLAAAELTLPDDFVCLQERAPLAFGGEHDVWVDDKTGLVVKATREERFGFLPDRRRAAKPSEYLSRLILSNRIFGDSVEVLGVWLDRRFVVPRIVTTQPWIEGRYATEQEIAAYMAEHGFQRASRIDHAWERRMLGGALIVGDLIPRNVMVVDGCRIAVIDPLVELISSGG